MPSELRKRILTAATEAFSQQGYAATSMRAVAESVGCTKPALYYHFGSKEDLFTETVRTHMQGYTDFMRETISRPGPLRDRVRALSRDFFKHMRQTPQVMRLLMTAEYRPDNGAPEIDLATMHEENVRIISDQLRQAQLTGELRDGLDLEQVTISLVSLIHGWGMQCVHGREMPEDTIDHILDLFFHGVAPT